MWNNHLCRSGTGQTGVEIEDGFLKFAWNQVDGSADARENWVKYAVNISFMSSLTHSEFAQIKGSDPLFMGDDLSAAYRG